MDRKWKDLQAHHGYELRDYLGSGSFGSVYSATNLANGENYAIKLVDDPFTNSYQARQLYREIKIMRKLSAWDQNHYTPHLVDIILPGCQIQNIPNKGEPELEDEEFELCK